MLTATGLVPAQTSAEDPQVPPAAPGLTQTCVFFCLLSNENSSFISADHDDTGDSEAL